MEHGRLSYRTKDADNTYLLEDGKTLFFPDGRSTKGRLVEFDCLVLDYKKGTMPDGVTVGHIFEMTKLGGYVRFYISSVRKEATAEDSVGLPDIMGVPSHEKNTSPQNVTSLQNSATEPASTQLPCVTHTITMCNTHNYHV